MYCPLCGKWLGNLEFGEFSEIEELALECSDWGLHQYGEVLPTLRGVCSYCQCGNIMLTESGNLQDHYAGGELCEGSLQAPEVTYKLA